MITRRHSFLLVEVIVSICLILVASCVLFGIEKNYAKKALQDRMKLEAERYYSLAVVKLFEMLYDENSRGFSLDDIVGRNFPIIQRIDAHPWEAKYTFKVLDKDANDPPTLYKVEAQISLLHPEWGEFFVDKESASALTFCMRRK